MATHDESGRARDPSVITWDPKFAADDNRMIHAIIGNTFFDTMMTVAGV